MKIDRRKFLVTLLALSVVKLPMAQAKPEEFAVVERGGKLVLVRR